MITILAFLTAISFFADNLALGFFADIKNPFLDYTLAVFSSPIIIFFVLIAGTAAYVHHKKREGAIPLLASSILTLIATYALKFLFHRARPAAELIIWGMPDFSFPSAHAAIAFCVFAVVEEEFKSIKKLWLIIAVMVTISRVYFSYHYLSDVVSGALLGYVIGIFVVRTGKVMFKKNERKV